MENNFDERSAGMSRVDDRSVPRWSRDRYLAVFFLSHGRQSHRRSSLSRSSRWNLSGIVRRLFKSVPRRSRSLKFRVFVPTGIFYDSNGWKNVFRVSFDSIFRTIWKSRLSFDSSKCFTVTFRRESTNPRFEQFSTGFCELDKRNTSTQRNRTVPQRVFDSGLSKPIRTCFTNVSFVIIHLEGKKNDRRANYGLVRHRLIVFVDGIGNVATSRPARRKVAHFSDVLTTGPGERQIIRAQRRKKTHQEPLLAAGAVTIFIRL